MKKLINHSIDSFKKKNKSPNNEKYLFVCEDLKKKQIIGTSGITAQIGVESPFYSYRIHDYVRKSPILNHSKNVRLLQLEKIKKGPTEIGTLYLKKNYRKGGLGRLLSFSRFLFMKKHPNRFKASVIAEMRGFNDTHGESPFWNSLGKRFFNIDFKTADLLSSKDKQFIADLMPKHPIYTEFLSKKAQRVIGKTHINTQPALNLLFKQGFDLTKDIDIFDAGPKIKAQTKKIHAIQNSKDVIISDIQETKSDLKTKFLVSAHNETNFKVLFVPIVWNSTDSIIITPKTAKILKNKNKRFIFSVQPILRKNNGII